MTFCCWGRTSFLREDEKSFIFGRTSFLRPSSKVRSAERKFPSSFIWAAVLGTGSFWVDMGGGRRLCTEEGRVQTTCLNKAVFLVWAAFESYILHGIWTRSFFARTKKRDEWRFFHHFLKRRFFFSELSSVGLFRSPELNQALLTSLDGLDSVKLKIISRAKNTL